MSMAPVGKIDRIPLRDVWKHEAHDFTKWLADNLDVLSAVIEPDLELVERESAAGSFSVDLLAEDGSGSLYVIENQLGKSDHDHLGKLLTYFAAFDGAGAIWIVGEPRPEHTAAVAWLNESTPADFFLVRGETIRIGDSPAALLLTPIVGPSAATKNVGTEKKMSSERHDIRRRFWTSLLEHAKTQTKLHDGIGPGSQTWIGTGAGKAGLAWVYNVHKNSWRVELYIDRQDQTLNEACFDQLLRDKDRIESSFGQPLDWQRLDSKRACRIAHHGDDGGWKNPEEMWPAIQSAMTESMIALEAAIGPFIPKLPNEVAEHDPLGNEPLIEDPEAAPA